MTKEESVKRLEQIEEEIRKLQEEASALKKELASVETAEKTDAFVKDIYNITDSNSIQQTLYSDTRTTPIMDKFYHSGKDYLVFKDIFHSYSAVMKRGFYISLVVKKMVYGISVIDSGLTMTDLKKSAGPLIPFNYYPESSRMYTLAKAMSIAGEKISDSEKIIPFEQPIRLGGQTYANQTGFGSEYNGDSLVTQGTLYGETTSFCIIGIIAR